jgi:plastocyanin
MRRRLLPAAIVAVAIALAACSASSAPGWTYAPAPSATAAASGAASGSPAASASASAAASPSPSAAPSASASAAPSGSPSGAELKVTAAVGAATSGFDPKTLETAASKAFSLVFDNQDNTVQHNLVLKNPDGSKVDIGDTGFFLGPKTVTYQVPALTAGDYQYQCEVHPTTMIGTLTVK